MATTQTAQTADSSAAFWTFPLSSVLESLQTSGEGLSTADAEERLARAGPNELIGGRIGAALRDSVRRSFNPLVVILLAASTISLFLGQVIDAGVILLMVVFSAGIDLFQTLRSTRAAERLRRRVEVQATVRRSGTWKDVSLRAIVPGDRIRLRAGDIVPADARMVASTALYLDESAFTGESLPVEKVPSDAVVGTTTAVAINAVFMGTVVSSGSGEVVAVHTGRATTYAGLAAHLEGRMPVTAFDRGLRSFSVLIARTIAALVIFVVVVNLLARRDPLESVLFAVALAVGLTPEFLPMILTVTQAEGALRMARSGVIVRRLAAIQNFGSIEILCSDKTGTLTEGRMQVGQSLGVDGLPNPHVLADACLNAAHQSGLRSPFDEALLTGYTEDALVETIGEIPFDFERRRLSVAVTVGGVTRLIMKGAPESVLSVSRWVVQGGVELPLDDAMRGRIAGVMDRLGEQGFRLLAVATRAVKADRRVVLEDEQDLTFEGFVAFADPPKRDIAGVVTAMERDGITLKIISGDAVAVTRHVCSAIGLAVETVMTGEQIDGMDDATLARVAEETNIFARVAPEQKLRLIHALQARGHVVGYLGDGINDAPSLRAADVGISVAGAVDVARDAAHIVLLEKDLAVLHTGVNEGRKSFGNVMKYIMMGTSSNFGNMLSMAGAVLFLPFLPLLPAQVLLNNWLYDLSQMAIPADRVDAALVRKPRHWDTRFIRDFMLVFGPISSLYDFLTFFALRVFFHAGPELFHTGWFVESLATQTLVVFVIRTAGNPLRSRPGPLLIMAVAAVVTTAVLLPATPLAHALGFVVPPRGFLFFVAAATATYLMLVECTKRLFYRWHPLAPAT